MIEPLRLDVIGKRLEPHVGDREFFKRHRTRRYRVRLATPEEIAAFGLPIPEGDFVFCAVQRVTMHRRLRALFTCPPEFAQKCLHDERAARFLFEETSLGRLPARDLAEILGEVGMAQTKITRK